MTMLGDGGLKLSKVYGVKRLQAAVPMRKRQSEGARLLEAVFPIDKNRKAAGRTAASHRRKPQPGTDAQRLFEAVFGRQKRVVPSSWLTLRPATPVKLQERRGGGVEAVLRREIPHSEMLSAHDFKRMRFLLWRAQQTARLQTLGRHKNPHKRRKVKWTKRALAVSWHTRLEHDAQGVTLVLANYAAHALYLALGARHVKPRAVFKSALASQQGAIDAEWQRLARLADMRHETRATFRF